MSAGEAQSTALTADDLQALRDFVAVSRKLAEMKKVLTVLGKRKKELESRVKEMMLESGVDNYDLNDDGCIQKTRRKDTVKKPTAKQLPLMLASWFDENIDDLVLEERRSSKLLELVALLSGKDKDPTFSEVIKLSNG